MSRKQLNPRKLKKKIVIFCEGETEKNYFTMLRSKYRSAHISVEGAGIDIQVGEGQAVKLVEHAKSTLERDGRYKGIGVPSVYVVFDKDDVTDSEITKAFRLAEGYGYKVMFSNECFEYWILLHFEETNHPPSRKRLNQRLSKHFLVDHYDRYKADADKLGKILKNRIGYAMSNPVNEKMTDPNQNPYTNAKAVITELFQRTEF